jgi:hypothetical protein
MSRKSLDLIEAMYRIADAAQPITGRGIGYKLFVLKLIPSMSTAEMKKVYRLLMMARERDLIPWDWIVDESRHLERKAGWDNPDQFSQAMANGYCREHWNQQPVRVEVWSEKGTVRGVLRPVLDEYGVGFRVVHGFASATIVHAVAAHKDGRNLIVLYVGDWDPSGLCMSEHDLPARLKEYDGDHVTLKRIALVQPQLAGLPSFLASDKIRDTRYGWFTRNHGHECWELDALDPNDLRQCVREAIEAQIEPEAWARCKNVEHAEKQSIATFIRSWNRGKEWGLC